MRRMFAAAGGFVSLLLLAMILVSANLISYRHQKIWDFSGQDIYKVSERTVNILKGLDRDVNIYVCFSPELRVRDWLKSLLDGYEKASGYVHVEFIDPD